MSLTTRQEKVTVLWDTQVAAYGARGTSVVKEAQNDLRGRLDGTSWHAKAKPAIRKKWRTFVDFAKDSLLPSVSIAESKLVKDVVVRGYGTLTTTLIARHT